MGPLTAYLFPGQGSQSVGMGRALYDGWPSAREVFAQADRILGFSLSAICFEGPSDQLDATVNTQPAVFTASIAALRALEDARASRPMMVAGHSVGEFGALVCAGVLTFGDALRLVRERARLMERAGHERPGRMVAIIGLEIAHVEEACQEASQQTGQHVGIANDNCPGQVVISGASQAVTCTMEIAQKRGAKRVLPLAVSIAAHSPLMAGAAAEFSRSLELCDLQRPAVPFVANATARPVTAPNEIKRVLQRQLTSPVHWADSVRFMAGSGVTQVVEVGPGSVLCGLVKRIDDNIQQVTTGQLLGY